MSRALVVGGANGIGLTIATLLAERDEYDRVYIVDKCEVSPTYRHPKFECACYDLRGDDFSFFDRYNDIDTLMITAGFGSLGHFANVCEKHIIESMEVNATAIMRLVHRFYPRISASEPFYSGVMGSIAGFMSSPLFAVYGASKAALKVFIESVNVELEMAGVENRILNVSPGNIKGTSFYAGATDMSITRALANEIIEHLLSRDDLFIPNYDEVYREVLERYHRDFRAEGRHSYEYKMQSGRVTE